MAVKTKQKIYTDYDIITIGSATMDVFAKSCSELIKIRKDNYEEELIAYPVGGKILITDLHFETGGGGTNTAVAFSRLGFKTAYLGNIGKDDNGNIILTELKKERVDFIGKLVDKRTNFSVILDSMEDDRTILTYKGSTSSLKVDDINLKKYSARWIYSSSMIEKSFDTLQEIIDYYKKKGVKFAFNPSSYQAVRGLKYLAKILKQCDILIMNEEEARLIVGKGEIKSLYLRLLKTGPKIVAITQGRKGASLCLKGKIYFAAPIPVEIVETTGAGDAFSSGLVAGFIMKNDPVFALKLGMNNAESVLSHFGAKNILLTKEQASKLVKKDSRKITIEKLPDNQKCSEE